MRAFYEPALWITQSFFSGIQTRSTRLLGVKIFTDGIMQPNHAVGERLARQ